MAGSVFGTPIPLLSLKPLVMEGVRGISHVLTESAVLPPYRVCTDGFDYACRAGTLAIGRPDCTVGAISAHSAPTVPSGRPNRSSPRPFSSHRGVAPSTLIATSPVPGPRPATPARVVRRAVPAPAESANPAACNLPARRVRDGLGCPAAHRKSMPGKRIEHFGDGRRSVLGQLHGQHVAKLDSANMMFIAEPSHAGMTGVVAMSGRGAAPRYGEMEIACWWRWRRRVCAGGAESAVRAAVRGGYRPPYTVKAATAHSMRRHDSRFGEHVRYPPKAHHHKCGKQS